MDNSRTEVLFIVLVIVFGYVASGCSLGTRKGYFAEYGVGGGVAAATEEGVRLVYKVWDYDPSLSEVLDSVYEGGGGGISLEGSAIVGLDEYSENVVMLSPATTLKLGWGLTDQFIVSTNFNFGRLSVQGLGLTYFQKSTAPSLFYSVVFPYSFYTIPYEEYEYYNINPSLRGSGLAIGVGYEHRKHLAVQMDFSFGEYGEFTGRGPSVPLHINSDAAGIPIDARTGTRNPVLGLRGGLVRFTISYLFY